MFLSKSWQSHCIEFHSLNFKPMFNIHASNLLGALSHSVGFFPICWPLSLATFHMHMLVCSYIFYLKHRRPYIPLIILKPSQIISNLPPIVHASPFSRNTIFFLIWILFYWSLRCNLEMLLLHEDCFPPYYCQNQILSLLSPITLWYYLRVSSIVSEMLFSKTQWLLSITAFPGNKIAWAIPCTHYSEGMIECIN